MNARTNMQSTAQELWLLALEILFHVLAHARSANGGATGGVCTERIYLSKGGFLPSCTGQSLVHPREEVRRHTSCLERRLLFPVRNARRAVRLRLEAPPAVLRACTAERSKHASGIS